MSRQEIGVLFPEAANERVGTQRQQVELRGVKHHNEHLPV